MPEEEGTVVADLEGQASESEDEDEGDDMMEGDEDEDLETLRAKVKTFSERAIEKRREMERLRKRQ